MQGNEPSGGNHNANYVCWTLKPTRPCLFINCTPWRLSVSTTAELGQLVNIPRRDLHRRYALILPQSISHISESDFNDVDAAPWSLLLAAQTKH
jgi:hypothetical protein